MARTVTTVSAPRQHADESNRVTQLRPGPLQQRVRSEFREMPGLRLTLAQAARLFGLSEITCRRVLDDLVGAGVLHRSADGRYGTRTPRA